MSLNYWAYILKVPTVPFSLSETPRGEAYQRASQEERSEVDRRSGGGCEERGEFQHEEGISTEEQERERSADPEHVTKVR